MYIGHRKEIRKLTFRALALRSDEGLTLETSASDSLYGGHFQEIIKEREWIPHIDLLAKVIRLKLCLDIVQVLSRILLARCVDVFVEDQFIFPFV